MGVTRALDTFPSLPQACVLAAKGVFENCVDDVFFFFALAHGGV